MELLLVNTEIFIRAVRESILFRLRNPGYSHVDIGNLKPGGIIRHACLGQVENALEGADSLCGGRTVDAIRRTAERGIRTGGHVILGLPGESKEDILEHARRISSLPLTTLKLHQLQLIRNTRMAKEYAENPSDFHLYTVDEYIDLAIDFVERLNPAFVVERFVSQSPKELLIAPDWGLKNYEFTAKVNKRFMERNTWQGKLYE